MPWLHVEVPEPVMSGIRQLEVPQAGAPLYRSHRDVIAALWQEAGPVLLDRYWTAIDSAQDSIERIYDGPDQ